ncbi:MAG: S-layer protein [uncultured bacterium (gcode 4)]|uniref:S-layer protein n=1 Tax=uncultured bacterium (gcode 4) TaxID=1234023 RepID=K2G4V4_9BACT|nr:MAG: S-layer protein [uncultured bacterium (gcode 4)]
MKTIKFNKISLITTLALILYTLNSPWISAKWGSDDWWGSSSSSSSNSNSSSNSRSSDDNLPRHSWTDDFVNWVKLRWDWSVDDNWVSRWGNWNIFRWDWSIDDNLPRHSWTDDFVNWVKLRWDWSVDDTQGNIRLDWFSDIRNNFARDDIRNLAQRWIIRWFDDSSFRPDRSVTRAEFLGMALKSAWISTDDSRANPQFRDVSEWWMRPVVARAKELGIVSGQNINWKLLFRPNDEITRAESISILLNIKNVRVDDNLSRHSWFDDVNDDRLAPIVAKAKEIWIISGQKINWKLLFRPSDDLTRAEAAKIITKSLSSDDSASRSSSSSDDNQPHNSSIDDFMKFWK